MSQAAHRTTITARICTTRGYRAMSQCTMAIAAPQGGAGRTRYPPRVATAPSARGRELEIAVRNHGVAAAALGGVEPGVGGLDQSLGLLAAARHLRSNADADAHLANRRILVGNA